MLKPSHSGPVRGAGKILTGISRLSLCVGMWLWGSPAFAQVNVLLIVVDDLRPALGTYGDADAVTPHIDGLAERGVVFEHAFANVPVCGASRASMLSGRKPTAQRFIGFDARLDEDLPGVASLPAWFMRHGYNSRGYGKVFDVTTDSQSHWSAPVWNPASLWQSPVPRRLRHDDLQRAYFTPRIQLSGLRQSL